MNYLRTLRVIRLSLLAGLELEVAKPSYNYRGGRPLVIAQTNFFLFFFKSKNKLRVIYNFILIQLEK
jgi:hypothetical protein